MKKLIALSLSAIMLFALTACGQTAATKATEVLTVSETTDGTADSPATAVTLKLGTILAPDHPFMVGYANIAAEVSEKSNGAVTIELYPSSELGGEPDLVSGMSMGTVDMASIGPSELANYIDDFCVFEVPYMFKDADHFKSFIAIDSPVGSKLYSNLENDMNIRVVMPIYNGARQVTSNKPIYTAADMAGMKMRCPNAQGSIDMVQIVFGAVPTPMNLSEVYLALQNGTADGQENPITNIYSNSFQEVQDYLVMTSHVQSAGLLCMSTAAVEKLTPEQLAIVEEAIANEAPKMAERIADAENEYLEAMQDAGMAVITSDEIDLQSFYNNASALINKYIEEGKFSQDLYDSIQALYAA